MKAKSANVLIFMTGLLVLTPVLHAEPLTRTAPATTASPAPVTKAAKRLQRIEVAKPHSKATRSVLKAMDSSQAYLATVAAAPVSETPASLSPVMTSAVTTDLRERPEPVEGNSLLDLPVKSGPLALSEESLLVEDANLAPERNTTTAAVDSDALDQESVSVIDRVAGKPRAKALSTGPLRVRVKDSGVRASVSIPVAGP